MTIPPFVPRDRAKARDWEAATALASRTSRKVAPSRCSVVLRPLQAMRGSIAISDMANPRRMQPRGRKRLAAAVLATSRDQNIGRHVVGVETVMAPTNPR
jgi:hypothetical protein